jgi:hypothetical protein
MKHIKPFNEANVTGQFLTDLRDFCENNLVYLMDDGLQVSVVKHPINREDMDNSHLSFVTLRYPLDFSIEKDWNDIKDSIIPFFTRLDREYNVITFDRLPIVTQFGLEKGSLIGQGINNTSQVQFGLRRRVLVNPALSNGGFRKNFTLDDLIGDRLDLGNNWIVEIRFYVSCNESNDVIKPVKKSIGSRIKKFLGFDDSHLR